MIAMEVFIGVLAAFVLLPAAIVFVQVIFALMRVTLRSAPDHPRPSLAVLIPAHNEAEGIAATLHSILPQLNVLDQLLVVADNCSDATAAIAAAIGARVVERSDPVRRGKGYALDFGIRRLAEAAPEVVIIVDADCLVEADGIDRLARVCSASQRPVQALYLMHASSQATLQTRIAEFAWVLKNWVRPLGSDRLGLPCQLMGTGMAFPWELISKASLANAELAEDMKLGIDLALSGHPPAFCPDARVTSRFPETADAASAQRTRWEHGHIGMILAETPRLLIRAISGRDVRLLSLGLDLAVPPLSLLVLLTMLAFAMALTLFWMGISVAPLAIVSVALGLLALSVLFAWLGWGRKILPISALLSAPLYVLAKVPLYSRFWTRRQKEWVRTERK